MAMQPNDPANFTPSSETDIGGNIAGRLFDVVRQLQKNRESAAGVRRPTPLAQNVAGGDEVMSALFKHKENEQKQNAAPAS
jgi:hypothetical protein